MSKALLTGLFLLWSTVAAFAVPDPRDSVIVESKTVSPLVGSPATKIRVFITNKDSLSAYGLALVEQSVSSGAYMTLSYPRTYTGMINPLTSTLQFSKIFAGQRYNSVTPDTFTISGYYDPTNVAGTFEPPNVSRKALLEIKFDSIWDGAAGHTITIDSAKVVNGNRVNRTVFVNLRGQTINVNFKKGIVTVQSFDEVAGRPVDMDMGLDMNADEVLTVSDYVLLWNCLRTGGADCGRNSPGLRELLALTGYLFGDTAFIHSSSPVTPSSPASSFPACMDMDSDGQLTMFDVDAIFECRKGERTTGCCDSAKIWCYFQALFNHLLEKGQTTIRIDCPP